MRPFEVLASILSTGGQLQFFVYLWLVISALGVFANHMTLKRVRQAGAYVGVTLVLLNSAFYYRMFFIRPPETTSLSSPMKGTVFVMSFLVYFVVVGGLFTAWGINRTSAEQRGWAYRLVTTGFRRAASFIETKANPVTLLARLADFFERKANEAHPSTKLNELLNSMNGDA